jgi:hypothetical protein
VIAYTIISRTYVPHARVLARSYSRHHPGEKLWALLIDDVDHQISDADEPFRALHLSDLAVDQAEIHRMAMMFGDKLIAVIKPWVFEHFLAEGADSVLYIDGDCVVYESIHETIEAAGKGVILVPHVLTPMPRDGKDPDETTILGAGMFNAGMFGVGSQAGDFIAFLKERLRRECIFDAPRMRFNEQRWLDFVPSLFPHHVVRDVGMDVAYWNLHERPLGKSGDRWLAGGEPLRTFHFSSFDPRTRGVGGRYELDPHPRTRVSEGPLFGELCDDYRRRLFAEGFTDQHDSPFGLALLSDGSPIYHSLRALFREAVIAADAGDGDYPPDPFDVSCSDRFGSWVVEQYAKQDLALPRRLRGLSHRYLEADSQRRRESGTTEAKRGRFRARLRRGGQFARQETPSTRSRDEAPTEVEWAIDWLDRMITDDAGERQSSLIHILPDKMGFVCHGPRAPLGPGAYQVTLEFETRPENESASPFDQALVVEAFVQGYVVGSRGITFAEIQSGAATVAVNIPEQFMQESLLFGVELRVNSRGGVNAILSAVVMEAIIPAGTTAENEGHHFDWLPVMAAGKAGLRRGEEIHTIAGERGVVAFGPNWRLVPGRYRGEMRTRASLAEQVEDATDIVAIFEAVVHGRVLAESRLTLADLARGHSQVEFSVASDDAGPDAQVGMWLRSEVSIEAAITSITVERVGVADG